MELRFAGPFVCVSFIEIWRVSIVLSLLSSLGRKETFSDAFLLSLGY